REAAYTLFEDFLKRKGFAELEIKKDVFALLEYAVSLGCFINPHTVHTLSEWRKFGDELWAKVIDDDKTARKFSKTWRSVYNTLLRHEAEKRAVDGVVQAKTDNATFSESYFSEVPTPMPPAFSVINMPAPKAADKPLENEIEAKPFAPPEPASENPPAIPTATSLSLCTTESVSGAATDLAEAMARERRESWAAFARQCMQEGDTAGLEALDMAFPIVYSQGPPDAQGRPTLDASITPLDWKLLAQLRSTVSQFGATGEPTRQILDYIWSSHILLPSDCRTITKLMYSPHQLLLFNAHWQAAVNRSVAAQRGPGDPLAGVTAEELLSIGAYIQVEAQALLVPDKCREAMRCVSEAMRYIKDPGGTPLYMSIKQGRDEPFGTFIDRVADAITKTGVNDYIKGALLKQCVLQNSNAATKTLISTLGADWTIEEALDRVTQAPTGAQVYLANALSELGQGIKAHAESTRTQVLAALAPLQAMAARPAKKLNSRLKCYRCGGMGHIRKNCSATGVWCQNCQSPSHNTHACHAGNEKASANRSCAPTKVAPTQTGRLPPFCSPQPAGVSAWTWQQQ
ncbi:GAK8 protein, partial [Neopipo cinnamomea]|nr:GAK8 protein [Neopipo cinnamomea]